MQEALLGTMESLVSPATLENLGHQATPQEWVQYTITAKINIQYPSYLLWIGPKANVWLHIPSVYLLEMSVAITFDCAWKSLGKFEWHVKSFLSKLIQPEHKLLRDPAGVLYCHKPHRPRKTHNPAWNNSVNQNGQLRLHDKWAA